MSLADALPKPEVFYDPWTSGKCYFVRNSRGSFIPVTDGALKRMLKEQGFAADVGKSEIVSELDRYLNEVQTNQDVDYAGPLAGYQTGCTMIQNRRVLVTESPRFLEPKDGPWPTLETLLSNLLIPPDDADPEAAVGVKQLDHFYSWLKVSITALRAGRRRPGQVLVMAGPPACGKSLVQNLITKMLGGRSAKPYQYMTGGTQFNSELFHAEHLMIEDETASFELRVRRNLAANLKGFVVNESQRCHPKNRPALTLLPYWRVSITLNDEPESLMVLPPIDDSLQDKMMMFRAYKAEMPMPTETLEQWAAFMQVIDAELPHFIHYILHEWKIPADMKCNRYGVTHYHHPELLQMMSVLAPENKLLELIDSELFGEGRQWCMKSDTTPGFEGKASDLEAKLCSASSSVAHEARKLMLYNSACGQYLGRLQRLHPERISSRVLKGYTIWEIKPPEA
jgi:hypothetical protein